MMRVVLQSCNAPRVLVLGVALVSCAVGVSANHGVSSSAAAEDELPVVQVRLAPPTRQLPQVAAEIGELEHLRVHLEAGLTHKLEAAYNATLGAARASISNLVDKSLTLLAGGPRFATGAGFYLKSQGEIHNAADGGFALKVNVAPIADPDPSIKGSIERVEDKRANDEVVMFEQACAEMQGLTDIVLNELGAELHAQIAGFQRRRTTAAFLSLPSMANVRVAAANTPFATVAGLVEVMEAERDNTESSERRRILELEMRLLQAEKQHVAKSLGRAMRRHELDRATVASLR